MSAATSTRTRIDTDALKAEHPLADVIASYGVTLRREGAGTFRGLCPFHQERTPSFWVDMRDIGQQHYYCFGCSANGDVITFVMEHEQCSFVEACERLGQRGAPPRLTPAPRASSPATGRRWEEVPADSIEARVLELAVQSYESALWNSERALAYLQRRGIAEDVARRQRLGYADGHSLLPALRATADGDQLERTAVDLGLVLERPGTDANRRLREFFYDRLIVPELRGGRPIWCIGRAVEDPPPPVQDETTSSARPRPKYLGLPGLKPVLGLEHVRGQRAVFMVEGPVDWLAAVGWSLPAFAICGTHFPADRLPALKEALAVNGVFDPDRAGQSAAERYAPHFGSRWRPIRLPNSLDLAELACLGEAGRQTFQSLVARARAAAWEDSRA